MEGGVVGFVFGYVMGAAEASDRYLLLYLAGLCTMFGH